MRKFSFISLTALAAAFVAGVPAMTSQAAVYRIPVSISGNGFGGMMNGSGMFGGSGCSDSFGGMFDGNGCLDGFNCVSGSNCDFLSNTGCGDLTGNIFGDCLTGLNSTCQNFGSCQTGGNTNMPALPGGDTNMPALPGGDTNMPALPGGDTNMPALPGGDTNMPALPGGNTNMPALPGGDTNMPALPGGNTNMPALPGDGSYAEQVLELVNEERAKAGAAALTLSSSAERAANVRAQEITQSFSHTRPNGSGFQTALSEAGVNFRTSGENIAYGQNSAEEVMQGWMNSSGHRANILNRNFTSIGIGHVESADGTDYWTQLFFN